MELKPFIGRGAASNPPNRFEEISVGPPPSDLAEYFEAPDPQQRIATRFYRDHSRSILATNESPDLGFTYSLNPYRGCEHGCIYCYARPSHEYLGFSSGLDFESRIMVKLDAPELLEAQFKALSWKPDVIVFSGNTDCYQPVERTLLLTRRCLEVFLKYRNPVSMITKNALIQRDRDLLRDLASLNLAFVIVTVTTLQQDLVRRMEPRTSSPWKRLETIEILADSGIPVGVNIAPVIPGLTDAEIPAILKEASERGARWAGHMMIRLSHSLKDLFADWIQRELPEKAQKVLHQIRSVRGGKLTSSEFGKRMTGEGQMADAINQLFESSCKRYHLNESRLSLATDQFIWARAQLSMF